jgi:hypothetical protein
MRLPGAFIAGATFMAWRANVVSPAASAVEHEMLRWILFGGLALVGIGLWEVVRAGATRSLPDRDVPPN